MVVNLACPKCGGQSTEYDEHKWSCLHCGNKFIYAPISPPQTHNYVQNTVNVIGQTTYELDVTRSKPAKAVTKTRYELYGHHEDSDHQCQLQTLDNYQRELSSSKSWVTCCLTVAAVFGFLTIICGIRILSILSGLIALAALYTGWESWTRANGENISIKSAQADIQSTEQKISALKNETVIVGYQPVCPFCMADVANPSEGLSHCLKCGKQFHYSNQCSYPVKFR